MNRWIQKYLDKANLLASPVQIVVFYYLSLIVVTSLLLCIPFFKQPGVNISFIDTIFMAVSTVSVTGLTTFPLEQVYNQNGIVLLEILFQIGGFGITMLSTFILVIAGRRIGLQQRRLIQTDMNQPRLSGNVRLVYTIFGIMLAIQAVFGVIFSCYLYARDGFEHLAKSIFDGFYISISALTNAGFDITGQSIIPYSKDYFFLFLIMILIFIGGLGFPVIIEVLAWIKMTWFRPGNQKFRFSLFAKLAGSFAVGFFFIGAILIFLSENNGYFANKTVIEKTITAMFYSVTTRNAGLQINQIGDFNTTTLLIFSILMFIGASPSSVGGGVRTTTIGILGLYLLSFIRGHKNVNVFNRRIHENDIQKSIVVVNLSILMCLMAVFILSITENQSLISLIVEVTSAFGTTGLSTGITSSLSVIGKMVIIILMFVGRVGMLYMLIFFVSKKDRDEKYRFPSEQIIIG
ncbi:TrkH family potassium uptake protein [Dellaglioa algida]|uniref:Ktr system potassium uptake protein D n=1 Tax=Dellaglioa algida TaxID=105612 RepID=A0A5C6MCL6_9LACO|nr:potassium transporter TrkG [Dellaglioa algida]MDK1716172.1 TrkH family potassium uptake protein [Dellaglioa algida]MDK1719453.1 TrkH family potassium uptake protein [Dellaglioa algida]MDK1721045.1 TrkH family potassium uptake protein [Dellaglioa algida]MDK1722796.1 TrkH family potassium uptake protein [Dellaglioa algida]MDK1724415.1 TrkH family potassium uptake protein [Dellaglioa algida]